MEELMLELYENNNELMTIEAKISLIIKELKEKEEELKNKNEQIKEVLKNKMEENGLKTYENAYVKLTYIAPTKRNTIDSKKLKEELPDVYMNYCKVSDVKSSIRMTIK